MANDRNPRNHWRAIIEAQNELLRIYDVELQYSAGDPEATTVLRNNITKIQRGRQYAWDALRRCH
jgi:hypothetical protein